MTRRLLISASAVFILLLIVLCLSAAIAAEGAIHPPRQKVSGICPPVDHMECRDVSVNAPDGVLLRAWYFEPEQRNGASILLLHGVGASRLDMVGLGLLLEHAGYTALIPDLRGHGESGGLVTYGVVEKQDISTWADWMLQQSDVTKIFGFGVSLGGSELLESLDHETRFRGVIAESAFSDFRSIGEERISRLLPSGTKWVAIPFVEAGILWADLRYSIHLTDASAINGLRYSKVPVFLIHGAADNLTSPSNSVALERANPSAATLWLAPGARHANVWAVTGKEFETRVLAWLSAH